MNFIVTGGCGFIGSHLVEALVVTGNNVIVVDDQRSGKFKIKDDNVQYVKQEVCSVDIKGKCDGIIHLANTPRIRLANKKPLLALRNGIDPTIHVAEMARKFNCPLYFASSSSTIYTDRTSNPYTLSKAVSEDILNMYQELYGVTSHIMYFYNVYGPREANYGEHSTVIRSFKTAVQTGNPLRIFGTGKKTRDFTHVYDVVDGMLNLLMMEKKPKQTHFGRGDPYSIEEIADAFKHPVVYEFDRKGEAQDTICEKPFMKSNYNVIDYIKFWKEEFNEAKKYFEVKNKLQEIDKRNA
jgi:UDP-glucose 4-epimerase